MPDTTTEPLVDPKELDSFKAVTEKLTKARRVADIVGEVTDQESAGEAADALKELRHVRTDAEAARKEAKAPYTQAGTSIDAAFKELVSAVDGAERSLKDRVATFERAKREEAEAERKRLQRNEERRQERENAKAEAEGRNSRRVDPTPPPPPPTSGARGQNSQAIVRKVRKYEIRDEAALPDEYLTKTPDRMKIKAAVAAGLAIPGVHVWTEDEVATR